MKINQPTLLVDREKALANIRMMVGRAESGRVRFRPHFKTHQSAEIGEWFRSEGVRQITVSSLDMALYFADHGWMDITVAFPVNILEIDKINVLAQRITLNLVVHSADAVTFLDKHLNHPVNVWVKVDVGTHRSGMSPGNLTAISDVVKRIVRAGRLTPVGLLAHAGHTYGMREKESIQEVASHVIHEMERYLNTLGTIALITPLLGLLGTVIGMIKVFTAIMVQGTGNASVLAGGISEALITTAAGLSVAIPTLIFHRVFQRRIDELVVDMEQEAVKLVDVFHGDRGKEDSATKRGE